MFFGSSETKFGMMFFMAMWTKLRAGLVLFCLCVTYGQSCRKMPKNRKINYAVRTKKKEEIGAALSFFTLLTSFFFPPALSKTTVQSFEAYMYRPSLEPARTLYISKWGGVLICCLPSWLDHWARIPFETAHRCYFQQRYLQHLGAHYVFFRICYIETFYISYPLPV